MQDKVNKLKEFFIPRPENQETLCNPKLCKVCKGSCCHFMGCHISPSDIKDLSRDGIFQLLNTGLVSIDWWETDWIDEGENIYFLRMRNKNGAIVDPAWGGNDCILVDEYGCMLDFQHRPKGARELVPQNGFKCKSNYTKEMCKDEWNREELQRILSEYIQSNYTDGLEVQK